MVARARTTLVRVALIATLAVACGDSTKTEPEVTNTVAASVVSSGTPEATRTESEAIATYLKIQEDEVPVSPNLTSLFFVDQNDGWALNDCEDFGENLLLCDLLATTDGGKTWRVAHRSYGELGRLQFLDGQMGIAGSSLRTLDGGETWTGLTLRADAEISDVEFVTPDKAFGISSGVIFEVNLESGEHPGWWTFNHGSPDCNFSGVSFANAASGWAGGFGPLGACLFGTIDGGMAWEPLFLGVGDPAIGPAFDQSERLQLDNLRIRDCEATGPEAYSPLEVRLFIPCDHMGAGIVATSTDGGLSWQFESERGDCLMGCQALRYGKGVGGPPLFLDLTHGWRRSAHQTMDWTTDGGATWNSVDSPALCCDATTIFFVDTNHGWATLNNQALAITTDGGRTWERVPVTIVD